MALEPIDRRIMIQPVDARIRAIITYVNDLLSTVGKLTEELERTTEKVNNMSGSVMNLERAADKSAP